jgi:hypothetical protein
MFSHFEMIESWHSNNNRADQHGSLEGSILRLPQHIIFFAYGGYALLLTNLRSLCLRANENVLGAYKPRELYPSGSQTRV